MTTTPTLNLGIPTSDAAELARTAALPKNPGLLSGVGAAIDTQWAGSWVARQIGRSGFERDTGFHLNPENEAVLTAGLPEQMWDFSEAVSMDHAMAIRNQRLGQVESLNTLSRMGWTGTALSVGAAMFDPVDIAAGIGVTALTGGTGLAPWIAGKAGRLRRLAGAGIVGAASALPVQAYISSQDELQDEWDVLFAAAGGAIGGAGFDALGQKWAGVMGGVRRDIEARDTLRYAMGAAGSGEFENVMRAIRTDKGRVYFRGTVADEDRVNIARRLVRGLGLTDDDADMIGELDALIDADPDAFMARLRTSPSGLLLDDSGPAVRDHLPVAAEPKADGTPPPVSLAAAADAGPMRNAMRTVRIGGQEWDAPDPVAAQILASAQADQIIRHVPGDARVIGAGASSIVLDTNDGFVLRIGPTHQRAQSTVMLQPTARSVYGEWMVERLPKADTSGITDADVAEIASAVRGEGFEFSDPGADQLGRVDGRLVVLDAGGLTPRKQEPPTPMRAGDFHMTDLPATDPARFAGARASYIGIFARSGGERVQRWALATLGDPLPRKGGPAPVGASEWVHRTARTTEGRFLREYDEAYKGWKADANRIEGTVSRQEFSRRVAQAIRSGETPAHPAIRAGAQAAQTTLRDTLALAQRHGALEDVESYAQYLPRLWSARAMQQVIGVHGQQAVDDLLAAAFKAAHPDLENVDEIAARVGRGMRQTILDASQRTDFDRARAMSGLDPDAMEGILRDAGITDPELRADIMYGVRRLKPDPEDKGKIPRGRARTLLDETAVITTPISPLRLTDLLDNDAEAIVGKYVRQVVGASAIARVYDAVGRDVGKTIKTQDELLSALQDSLREGGVPTDKAFLGESIDSTLNYARQIDNHLRGVPLVRDQGMARFLRRLRQYQHMRLSGSFGWASLPETMQIVAETGLTAAVRGMPSFGRLLDDFRRGAIKDDFIAEIEQVLGVGLDQYVHRIAVHAEDADGMTALGGIGRGFDRLADKANQIGNLANFLAPLTRFQQLWAAGAALQKWAAIARSGKVPSASRLRAMNVTEAQAQRIIKAMRAEMDRGGIQQVDGPLFGRKVTRLNFDQWQDQEAASILIGATDRWTRRTIQTSDIGSMVPWMANNAWGRTLTQFRSFAVQAWEKQFLHSLTTPDLNTAMRVLLTGVAGALVWSGQSYLRSLAEPDPQAFREKALTPGNFAAATFARSGWSSILPGAVDNLVSAGGSDDAVFNFRNSGLGSRLVDGESAASVEFVNSMQRAANSSFGPLWREDDPFSQRDAEAVYNLLPFSRLTGARNLFRSMLPSDLPETDVGAR